MASEATVTQGNGSLGALMDWSVSEDATPSVIGSTSPSVGDVSITAKANESSIFLGLNTINLAVPDYGSVSCKIDSVPTVDNSRVTFAAALGLAPLNIDVTAPPIFGGQTLSDAWATYLGLAFATPPAFSYLCAADPVVRYIGWTGNLWQNLNNLGAATKTEMSIINGVITIRDMGALNYELSNVVNSAVQRAVTQPPLSLYVHVTYQDPIESTSLLPTTVNYSRNPSVETNATDWANASTMPTNNGRTAAFPSVGTYSFWAQCNNYNDANVGQKLVVRHRIDVTDIPDNDIVFVSIGYRLKFAPGSVHPFTPTMPLWASIQWSDGNIYEGGSTIVNRSINGVVSGRLTLSNLKKRPAATYVDVFMQYGRPTADNYTVLGGDALYVDAAMLGLGTPVAYFDGSSAFVGTSWQGTANNSRSISPNPGNTSFYDALADDNSIYTVNAGEITEIIIPTDNFPFEIAQPVFVTQFPVGPGQYIVSGGDGVPVNYDLWRAYGGDVKVSIGEEAGELILTLVGPSTDLPPQPGPYSLSVDDGLAGGEHATFNVIGTGVLARKKTLEIYTGAPATATQNQVGAELDIPFVVSAADGYRLGEEAAARYGGTLTTISFTVPFADATQFGDMTGRIVSHDRSCYRITKTTVTATGVQCQAETWVTASKWDTLWDTASSADFDAVWGKKPYDGSDFEVVPLWR